MFSLLSDIESRVMAFPNAQAITFESRTLTYKEFWQQSLRTASALRRCGVKGGDFVAIMTARNEYLPCYLVGVLLSGAAYVPIDPKFPLERQLYMLQDSAPVVAICDDGATAGLTEHGIETLTEAAILNGAEVLDCQSEIEAEIVSRDIPLAYMIYTSGSTGKPKGVEILRSNMANFIESMASRPGFTSQDTLLSVTTISFDIHVLEIFLPLFCGGHIVICSDDESRSGTEITRLLDAHRVTVMQATPATWTLLRQTDKTFNRPIKSLVGGEALDKGLCVWMTQAFSEVWNMYGPTETTVWSTCAKITNGEVSIGRPINNTFISIVDENLVPVVPGEEGELLIGGEGVARGYHNQTELTAERFFAHKGDNYTGIFYRTGDLCKYDEEGVLYCLGRMDSQVKINGYRIELGEIEHQLDLISGIKQAVVCVDVNNKLVAFIQTDHSLEGAEVKNSLRNFLPSYMVPSEILQVDEFPLTPNRKLDKLALVKNINQYRKSNGHEAPLPENEFINAMILIWRSVLNNSAIGADDKYADVGGDSLRIFSLIHEINISLGIEFSPDKFLANPSVRELYESISESSIQSGTHIVPLQVGGNKTPIYACCGVGLYQELANKFASERSFFGVYAHQEIQFLADIYSGKEPELSVNNLGGKYVEAIARHVDKDHAFYVLGFSFGGLLGHYVASELEKRGYRVLGLIVIDTVLPIGMRKSIRKLIKNKFRKFRISKKTTESTSSKKGDALDRLRFLLENTQLSADKAQENANNADKVRDYLYDRATMNYIESPGVFSGDTCLIKARENEMLNVYHSKNDYGWGTLPGLKLRSIDSVGGGHRDLLEPKGAIDLYAVLKKRLDIVE